MYRISLCFFIFSYFINLLIIEIKYKNSTFFKKCDWKKCKQFGNATKSTLIVIGKK